MKKQEIPSSTNHNPAEVARALTAFRNQEPGREFLAKDLLDRLLPDRDIDGDQNEMYVGMQDTFNEMKKARRFTLGYIGHMLSESSIPSLSADFLAREVGSNTVAREVSMVESRLEKQTVERILSMIGYDSKEASGTFCSGGTMANMTALTIARKVMETNYERIGEKFPEEVWVLTTDMAHYSIPKSVDLLGGPRHNIKIKTVETKGLKMSTEDLEAKIALAKKNNIPVMAVVAIMGETETGLVDDLEEITRITRENNIFTIADGAYGTPYILSRNGDKFKGLGDCDATVFDVHKCFYTPYGGGFIAFKDSSDHAGLARGVMANYIGISTTNNFEEFERQRPEIAREFREGTGRLGAKRIEGSMSAAAILSTKATLETLGEKGLATIYDLTLDRTEHLHQRLLASSVFKPYHDPELNLLCFILKDEILTELGLDKHSRKFMDFIEKTRLILDNNIEAEGGYYFSQTDLIDESQNDPTKKAWTWRACIMNPWTTDKIIDAAIDNLEMLVNNERNPKTAVIMPTLR